MNYLINLQTAAKIKFEFYFTILVQGLTKIGIYLELLKIAMIFLALPFFIPYCLVQH